MNVPLSGAFVLCWSSGFIGARLGAGSADAVTILMWRFLRPAAVLAAVAVTPTRTAWRGPTARDLLRQSVIGALSRSGYPLTVYYAIQRGVSSGTTALSDGTQPLVAGALAGPLLHQYVSARQWLGLRLGVSGVAMVTPTRGPLKASLHGRTRFRSSACCPWSRRRSWKDAPVHRPRPRWR